ncbi:MAG: autotransporter outer membrane beta-barrel domain-containing protein [Alphaproteobacteria bacterium]|nr:autotransporter outer membrane beta-barrel domain-containing protein [Alphaproteobacteria bacterium]
MNLVGARLAPATGRSAGDFTGEFGGLWAKGLYNRSKQDGQFHRYTKGVAMGADVIFDETFTLGVGYAYNTTDVKADARKTDIKGHNFFAYAEYQPNNWFMNAAVSYSKADYTEHKELVGEEANYNVETYGAQAMTGYDFAVGLTPQVGLRYLHVRQDSYNDGLTSVKTEDTDLLTAVAGINFAKDMKASIFTFTPELRLAATYDVVSDGTEANVILGNASYTVKGQRLPRFGVETGVGVQMNVADRLNVNVDYDLGVRRDYMSHTGTVSLKYNF